MINVTHIAKSYGSISAVTDVSFTIETGEIVGLLGPNGAGKTTTLNIVTGVLMPDRGEVSINGASLAKNAQAIKRTIGYLAEDNPLYDGILVSESLQMAARLKGMSVSEFKESLDSIVDATGISAIYYRPIHTLSKGLRQRVGFAQALLGDPSVLILDEPTEGLDPNQRQEIRKLISKLGKDHTVLLSTHVMQEVEAICERVVILNEGEVVASGSVADITQQSEGRIEIEFSIGGDHQPVVDTLSSNYELRPTGMGRFSVIITIDQQNDFYRAIGTHTSDTAFVTHLTEKRQNLEDVFQRLTKGKE